MAYRKLDEVWLDDSDEKLYRRTGENFTEVSPSLAGGEGAVNYAKNPLEESNLSNLTYSGFTPAWNTTYNLFGGGALRCDISASGTGRYLRIALDDLSDAQITEMLRLSFFYKLVTGGDDAVRLSIWDGTNHTYFNPEYLVSASGDITKYDGWTYSISKTSHYLQFTFKDSTSIDFYLAAVSFVPRVLPQGAVISEWQDYTPTFQGFGTVTGLDAKWRRVGSSLEVQCRFTTGTVSSAGVEARMSLPDSLQIGPLDVANKLVGMGTRNGGGSYSYATPILATSGNTFLNFGMWANNNLTPCTNVGGYFINHNEPYSFTASVPISGWTSSINLVTDAKESAFNTQASANVNDTTSFGYGDNGTPILNNTATTYYDVLFKSDIQTSDLILVEVRHKATGRWINSQYAEVPSIFTTLARGAIVSSTSGQRGVGFTVVDRNKVRVYFMSGLLTSNSYAADVTTFTRAWSSVTAAADGYDRWRVRKISNGNMAEAPASGIYESGSNANGYFVKYVDGTMECWGGKAVSGLSNGSTVQLNFPASFVGGNYQTIIISPEMCHPSSGGGYTTVIDSSVTNTYFSVGIWSPPSSSYITYHAIGRWNLSRSVAAPGTVGEPTPNSNIKAWAKFNSTISDNLGGTYSISGTVGTITATAHGLKPGNVIRLDFTSGSGVDGNYTVQTVPSENTFTITHGSTTTSGNVTLLRIALQAGSNISCVSQAGVTGYFFVNFRQDIGSSYVLTGTASQHPSTGTGPLLVGPDTYTGNDNYSSMYMKVRTMAYNGTSYDSYYISVAFIGS